MVLFLQGGGELIFISPPITPTYPRMGWPGTLSFRHMCNHSTSPSIDNSNDTFIFSFYIVEDGYTYAERIKSNNESAIRPIADFDSDREEPGEIALCKGHCRGSNIRGNTEGNGDILGFEEISENLKFGKSGMAEIREIIISRIEPRRLRVPRP